MDAAAYQMTDLSQEIDWVSSCLQNNETCSCLMCKQTMWDSHFLGQTNSLPEQTWHPNSNANMDELLNFDDPTNIINMNYYNSIN